MAESQGGTGDTASLAATVLDEESRRQAESSTAEQVVLPDDLLPGVGGQPMALGDALRAGA